MKEKNKVGALTVSDFKAYYKAIVIMWVWYWQEKKKRQIGQWNRIKSSEIYSYKYGQMTFGKEAKAKQ